MFVFFFCLFFSCSDLGNPKWLHGSLFLYASIVVQALGGGAVATLGAALSFMRCSGFED